MGRTLRSSGNDICIQYNRLIAVSVRDLQYPALAFTGHLIVCIDAVNAVKQIHHTSVNIRLVTEVEIIGSCPKCGRPNRSRRSDCLYCGSLLRAATNEDGAEQNEFWIVVKVDHDNAAGLDAIAEFAKQDPAAARSAFASGCWLPLTAARSRPAAESITSRLAENLVDVRIFDDNDLLPSAAPMRLTGIDDDLAEFRARAPGDLESLPALVADTRLVVHGTLRTAAVERTERRTSSGRQLLNETTANSDEAVLDLFLGPDDDWYRIRPVGFDFSCLGDERTLIAADNVRKLGAKLAQTGPDAVLDTNFDRSRRWLESVWPSDSSIAAAGFERSSFGKPKLNSVERRDNLSQFTRYSRMIAFVR